MSKDVCLLCVVGYIKKNIYIYEVERAGRRASEWMKDEITLDFLCHAETHKALSFDTDPSGLFQL